MAPVRAVYDIFLGVLRQNELRSRFIAFKKNPLLLVCLHSVCFFFLEQNQFLSFYYFIQIRKKTPGPMLRSPE